ncbi:MAG: hypothetical protein ACK5JO_14385 [Halodesulfovibrio sp.]
MAAAASGAQAVQMGVTTLPGAASAVKEGAKVAATGFKNRGLDAANAVLSRPATINGAGIAISDLVTGYKIDGPYEPTPAGAMGFATSAIEKLAKSVAEQIKETSGNEK